MIKLMQWDGEKWVEVENPTLYRYDGENWVLVEEE